MLKFTSKREDPVLSVDHAASSGDTIVFDAVLSYPGDFVDGWGTKVKITKESLERLALEYTEWVESNIPTGMTKAVQSLYGKKPQSCYGKVIANHNENEALNIMGDLLSLAAVEGENGFPLLTGKLAIRGAENLVKVYDGRLSDLSLGLKLITDSKKPSFDDYGIREVSFVVSSAIKGASVILSEKRNLKEKRATVETLEGLKKDISDLASLKMTTDKGEKHQFSQTFLKPRLSQMVKRGELSRAASTSIFEEIKNTDKKTQDIVLTCLKTTRICPTIPLGHLADIPGALRTDKELNKLGLHMKKTDEHISSAAAIKNLASAAKVETKGSTSTDVALAALKEQALKFSEENSKTASLLSVVKETFSALKDGKTDKAVVLLSEFLGEPLAKEEEDVGEKNRIKLSELETTVLDMSEKINDIVETLTPAKGDK